MKDDGGRNLPQYPTNSLAGSKQRIEIYRQRWARGEAIFHPADNSHCLPDRIQFEPQQTSIRLIRMAEIAKSAF